MWRITMALLSLGLLTAAGPPPSAPTVGELSQAVAEVNDWRALGIFAFAMMLLQMGLVVFAFVQLSRVNRERDTAEKALAEALTAQAVAMAEIRGTLMSILPVISRVESEIEK